MKLRNSSKPGSSGLQFLQERSSLITIQLTLANTCKADIRDQTVCLQADWLIELFTCYQRSQLKSLTAIPQSDASVLLTLVPLLARLTLN